MGGVENEGRLIKTCTDKVRKDFQNIGGYIDDGQRNRLSNGSSAFK